MNLVRPLLFAALTGTVLTAQAAAVTFSAAATEPIGIQATVDAYRASLGMLNPNVDGSSGSGRREINWDGVPVGFADPNILPGTYFNTSSPRGVVLSTPGSGFQVSANSVEGAVEFGNMNASYPTIFDTFSAQRLFTALGSNIVDVSFFVPGSTAPAWVSGFGAVFTDVDLASTTSLQFFGLSNESLGTFFVSALLGDGNLSFLGVQFNGGEQIGRVRITAGNSALGPFESGALDLVVMDDFIYAEPIGVAAMAVSEPSSLALLLLPLLGLALVRRGRTG